MNLSVILQRASLQIQWRTCFPCLRRQVMLFLSVSIRLLEERMTLCILPAEKLEKTSEILTVLASIGLNDDIKRSHDGKHIRAGKGKMRGRRYRQPKSILFVASEGSPVLTGAKNLPGVNSISPKGMNTELLAPGGDHGRLVVFSKKAFETIGGDN